MRVISKKKLVDFYIQPEMERAKKPLLAWHRIVEKADWTCFQDVKRTFGHTIDQVGDCAVFDVKNNEYRVITRLRFQSHRVYVLKVMTHAEYDEDAWKISCGCFADPPVRKAEKVHARKKH